MSSKISAEDMWSPCVHDDFADRPTSARFVRWVGGWSFGAQASPNCQEFVHPFYFPTISGITGDLAPGRQRGGMARGGHACRLRAQPCARRLAGLCRTSGRPRGTTSRTQRCQSQRVAVATQDREPRRQSSRAQLCGLWINHYPKYPPAHS